MRLVLYFHFKSESALSNLFNKFSVDLPSIEEFFGARIVQYYGMGDVV